MGGARPHPRLGLRIGSDPGPPSHAWHRHAAGERLARGHPRRHRLPRRLSQCASRHQRAQGVVRGRRDVRLHHRLRAGQARQVLERRRAQHRAQEDEGQSLRAWCASRGAGRGRGGARYTLRRARGVRPRRPEADSAGAWPESLSSRVLLMHPILDPGPAILAEAAEVLTYPANLPLDEANIRQAAEGCIGIVSQLMDPIRETALSTPGLKCVSNVAVGFDNIDVAAATGHKVMVTNTPGVLDDSTSDFAFTLIMAAARRVVEADSFTRSGRFRGWAIDMMLGQDVNRPTSE